MNIFLSEKSKLACILFIMTIKNGMFALTCFSLVSQCPVYAIITAGNPFDPAYNAIASYGSTYTGVAQVLAGGSGICSGALIGPSRNYVLTAAHCVTNASTGVPLAATNFSILFAGQTASQAEQAVAVFVNPSFQGTGGSDANDIAVLQLLMPESSDISTYSLYSGAVPFGSAINIAGWAAGGTGVSGPDGNSAGGYGTELRVAGNNYNFYKSGDSTHLLFTFESGDAVNNAACYADFYYSGTVNASNNPYSSTFSASCPYALGVGNAFDGTNFEGSIGPGDSGGPSFYDGQIIGVHSYGTCIAEGLVNGYQCSDAETDPQGPDYNPNTPANTINFDFGELAGDTNVSLYTGENGFLTQFTVPEPSTWAVVFLGSILFYHLRVQRGKGA